MNLNQIKPVGPHIEGVIRFASEGDGIDFQQLDYFEVLSRVHNQASPGKMPSLRAHPITDVLLDKQEDKEGKIRVIPIRLIADKPENSLRARYEAYDTDLCRLVCVGDGEKHERANLAQGVTASGNCAGPESCEYANSAGVQCSLHVRMRVQIEGQADCLSVFELQSSGINTYRTLAAKLEMMSGLFNGELRGLPLELAAYDKSSSASGYQVFHVADLRLRGAMTAANALKAARATRKEELEQGLNHQAMEAALERMSVNGPLTLNDADSSIVTYSTGVVDREKMRRSVSAVTASASDELGSLAIAEVINIARRKAAPVEAPIQPEAVTLSVPLDPVLLDEPVPASMIGGRVKAPAHQEIPPLAL